METDLHAVIRANILEEIHKQYIMYQLFKALKYMHTAELLHRDIKVRPALLAPDCACRTPSLLRHPSPRFKIDAWVQPSNLLLNSECLLKLADFGLARSVAQLESDEGPSPILTDYVATRWYRAPEILLGSTKYTFGVDMWSAGETPCFHLQASGGHETLRRGCLKIRHGLNFRDDATGCILGELLCGKPIFPGTSTMNQLDRIMEVTGESLPSSGASLPAFGRHCTLAVFLAERSTDISS